MVSQLCIHKFSDSPYLEPRKRKTDTAKTGEAQGRLFLGIRNRSFNPVFICIIKFTFGGLHILGRNWLQAGFWKCRLKSCRNEMGWIRKQVPVSLWGFLDDQFYLIKCFILFLWLKGELFPFCKLFAFKLSIGPLPLQFQQRGLV